MDLRQILILGSGMLFLLMAHRNLLLKWCVMNRRRRLPRRRWWVRPVNRMRDAQGFYANLVTELLTDDHEEFFGLFRMWPAQFNLLVQLVHPFLIKWSIRPSLPTDLRLAVTLLYLSQGGKAKLQHAEFRIGVSTTHKVIHETCRALWNALNTSVLKVPDKADWKLIADDFMRRWQFPNCVGAIDGKHMRIQCPPGTGSEYFNYKQFFSMVLLATCDSKYKFTWIDIGQYGSISDGGVWANTDFASDLEKGVIDLPDPMPLPGEAVPFPYVFVGDEAFPLTTKMMRPYPRRDLTDEARIFNYRLSRARRTIENTFGILTARWEILHKPLRMTPNNCEGVFKALVCLHNYIMLAEEMRAENERMYAPPDFVDCELPDGSIREGEWRRTVSPHFQALGRVGGNRANTVAYGMRDYLCDYFSTDLAALQVPWQYELVFRGFNINPPA